VICVSLLKVTSLNLSFGSKQLFDNAAITIGPTDRIGLVGANGTGKSTLLKVLIGEVKADTAKMVFRRGSKVGYLPQDLQSLPLGNLVESVLSTLPGKNALEERLHSVENELQTTTDEALQMELATALAELIEEREAFDARFGRHKAESILHGLGFSTSDFAKETSTFSGGWKMRAALASLLLQDPDLLLLDEPTNHLDLPTLAWFDSFLKRSRKAFVLISHDREFLNRQINTVVSLELEGVRSWAGNYEDYRRLRAEEYERLLAQSAKVDARREELTLFINRFRAKASKAAQAQSKMKELERLKTVDVHEERSTVGFKFPPVTPSGREVVKFSNVSKSFGALSVYKNVTAQVQRGQRIAVVGFNGAGKTTLLKLLADEISCDTGSVTLGHNVTLGYYAQHHGDTLNKENTILAEMMNLVPDKPQGWVRSILGSFLFSGDDVEKPIGVLSGGERARVALAKLLLKPANLMVMDEPTNHLDLDSSEALIEALQSYEGTLMFVSHNRSFLDALATDIWDVRNQSVIPFPGNLKDYLHHLDLEAVTRETGEEEQKSAESVKSQKRLEAEQRQQKSAKLGPLKKEIVAIEKKIAELEAAQKERENQLSDAAFASDFAKSRPVLESHRETGEELEKLLARWELAHSEMAALG
jgi:ATP-binding cassette, subfamily F, member 3